MVELTGETTSFDTLVDLFNQGRVVEIRDIAGSDKWRATVKV